MPDRKQPRPQGAGLTRRALAPGAAALTILPRHVLGGAGYRAPSDKLNIAGVGVGAMGGGYLRNCETENIAVLCDVDDAFAARTFSRYPNARRYRDFRKMLEQEKGIDAVVIGTPDHTHAVVAMAAMRLRKHVYCAKPLTRTLHEARLLAQTAREMRVATQMSVQSSASEGARLTEEWIQAGAVGEVREAHVWTNRPIWPQGLARPRQEVGVPKTLDWDLWLGPAPARPYHPAYHPFSWRGWYDFGTGALGDMACHAFHVVFRALKLGQPVSVHATSAFVVRHFLENADGRLTLRPKIAPLPETYPHASIVTWDFPARGSLPPVRMHWYDGGVKPPVPRDMAQGQVLKSDGAMYVGDKGTLITGFSGGDHVLLPESRARSWTPPPKALPRSAGHYQEWIAAAKGGPPATCEFGFGGLIAETALLGTVAQRTGKHLGWDAENLRFTNDASAGEMVRAEYRPGWSL